MAKQEPGHRYLFKVPNDKQGNAFIDNFKSTINTTRWRVVKRGSGSPSEVAKKAGVSKGYYRSHIPLEYASHIRVYVWDDYADKLQQERNSSLWHKEWEERQRLQDTVEELQKIREHLTQQNYGLARDRLNKTDDRIQTLLENLGYRRK